VCALAREPWGGAGSVPSWVRCRRWTGTTGRSSSQRGRASLPRGQGSLSEQVLRHDFPVRRLGPLWKLAGRSPLGVLAWHAPLSGETKPAVRAGSATTLSGEFGCTSRRSQTAGPQDISRPALCPERLTSRSFRLAYRYPHIHSISSFLHSQLSPCRNLFVLAYLSMEIQPPELTVAEMLRLHRAWITMLFVEQNKTEAEIVQMLYERNIIVSWVLPSLL
jgi:hypothetical protein